MSDLLDMKPVRVCIAVIGHMIMGAGFTLLVPIFFLMFHPPADHLPAQIGASICVLLISGVGAALGWYGMDGIFDEPSFDGDLQERILEIAEANDGRVSIDMIASGTDLSAAESESLLTQLIEEGSIRVDLGSDDDSIYVFPGLDDPETEGDERQLDAERVRARRSDST